MKTHPGKKILLLISAFVGVCAPAIAGPGSAAGPITVDSTTFVGGSSVMGTEGGVYSDTLPPIASTTTAAFRMTKYRGQHVNLRDSSGIEIGTVGNPLNVSGTTTVQISTVQVTNSSFSVTGSTVVVTAPAGGSLPVTVGNTVTVTGSVTATPAINPLPVTAKIDGSSNTVKITGNVSVQPVAGSTFTVTGSTVSILGTVPVSGTFWQATQPISGTVGVSNSSFSVTGSTVNVNVNGTVPVSGSFFQSTQPVYVINPTTATVSGSVNVTGSTVGITGTVTAMPTGTQNVYLINPATTTITGIVQSYVTNPTTSTITGAVNVTGSTVGVTGIVSLSGTSSVNVINTPNVQVSNTPNVAVTSLPNVTIGTIPPVTVTNSSFSVSGSTVTIGGTLSAVITGTAPVNIINTPTVNSAISGVWPVTMQVLNGAASPTSVGYSGGSLQVPSAITDGVNVASVTATVNGNGLNVNIVGGGGNGGTSSDFGTTYPSAGTAGGFVSTLGNMQAARVDASSNVFVSVIQSSFSVSGSTVVIANQLTISTSSPFNVTGSTVGIVGTINVGNTPNVSVTNTPSVSVTNTVGTTLTAPLPLGTNNIGTVSGSSVTILTSGGGNLPISGTVTANAGTGTFSTTGSTITILNTAGGTLAVSGTVAATQSGTWTDAVNQGTNRWNVFFSTSETTAVLSSTATTSSVAISTPIAGLSSQTVRVFRLMLTVDAATTITFRDGSTNFGDSQYLTANGSIVLDLTNEPWYITSSSNGFVIKQSGTANIGARIWFTQS